MFGYILPEKPELKIKEYEMFRAFYCGVCKSIGKRYGFLPRLTLTYDAAFLALLIASIASENHSIKSERCIVHPVKKNRVIKNSAVIDYSSDMNILLAYYNLEDNWKDEHSILSLTGELALKRSFGKIKRNYKEKCGIIKDRLVELTMLEKEGCSSLDKAAEPFALLMEEVMDYEPVSLDERYHKILRWIGYNIGKWIYVLDAYDDIEKDVKKGAYNPVVSQFGYEKDKNIVEFKNQVKERIEFILMYCLDQIAKAYELLDIKSNKGLIENIIYMGMLRKTEQILGTGSCREVEKSI